MSELSSAIKNICEEKGLSYESVVATIEQALAAAYRKDYGQKNQNIKVEFNPETAKSKVFDVKMVVEDLPEEELEESTESEGKADDEEKRDAGAEKKTVNSKQTTEKEDGKKDDKKKDGEGKKNGKKAEDGSEDEEEEERKFNPKTEIEISEAKLLKKTAKIGDEIKTKLDVPESYGRMAAQTAKQVIIQRLREAEREMVFNEFKDKEGEVVSGVVQRREGRIVLVDLGKSTGYLPGEEQIYGEDYKTGERVKVYIKEVRLGSKGAEIILSRTSDEILRKVFYLEIPEISNGLVELKAVAREAGSRSKVAVATDSDNVDPIGSCVGQRGARIQTIISELGGEKVDIIEYDEDPAKFIANALSPAKIINIEVEDKTRKAIVKVVPEQLSLAIGKNGQNARLAARLTGWKIDIVGEQEKVEGRSKPSSAKATEDKKSEDEKGDKEEKKEKGKPSSAKATEDKKAEEGKEGKKGDKTLKDDTPKDAKKTPKEDVKKEKIEDKKVDKSKVKDQKSKKDEKKEKTEKKTIKKEKDKS